MRYKYASHLSDLKDLRHIEWFLEHIGEFEIQSPEAKEKASQLRQKITNKNIYYSDIVRDYEWIVKRFDNDPYNYIFDIEAENSAYCLKSNHYFNYFIEITDDENRIYTVSYQYILDNDQEAAKRVTAKDTFMSKMAECKEKALENMNAVSRHYFAYWHDSGVGEAIKRFESVGCGKGYRLPKLMLLYFLYNLMYFIVLSETKCLGMILHIWQIFSDNPDAEYSLINLYTGHKFLGIIIVLFVIYFTVMNVHYGYGISYLIYIKNKYANIVKYQNKISDKWSSFWSDYRYCQDGIKESVIEKKRNRESVYVPLVEAVNRRYDFSGVRIVEKENEKGEKQFVREKGIESIIVPRRCFYTQPLKKRVIWLLILLVVVQAICNPANVLFY